MRNRIDHWLLFAMFFVEALRGITDIRDHIRWLQARAAKAKAMGDVGIARSLRHRAREWAVLAGVCAIAIVPAMYYGVHAALVT